MDDLTNDALEINSKEDFLAFFDKLITQFETNPQSWENKDLRSYLNAMYSWIEDMNGFYKNTGLPIPQHVDWKTFGHILIAATMYE
ncbi:DUF7660 family protein [Chitinophaga pinensis]|uniref:DUF7660 domain-containing protein n=1 Tax=Chitinophaga pinensis (strain ATCC 43595 / DSM 2588 / LMG 13176 / NBRC 15968 / NCIMB 11800 / UQM 2034) TaxID=485918 RepID=A0A979G443_CHIPD|nr:hypothetical protein [Chitinophaga pinensis]ACU60509.1 conserved hypothetical protein [Chitinophaga pinensis DSM 2588]